MELKLSVNTASISEPPGHFENGLFKAWISPKTKLIWDVTFHSLGYVDVSLGLANDQYESGAIIAVTIGDETISGPTSFSGGWHSTAKMHFGFVTIKNKGRLVVSAQLRKLRHMYAGDLSYVLLSGPGAQGAAETVIPRAADAVHLRWHIEPQHTACKMFYNCVKVTETYPGTFFVACGFDGGYFGMQHNDFNNTKTIIFSLWDVRGGHPRDADAVREEDRVSVVSFGHDVLTERFGNEGTGAHARFLYQWEVGVTYHFVLKVTRNLARVQFSAYFYLNESGKWKKMACFEKRIPYFLEGLYSFIEDFHGHYGYFHRKALFGPAWWRSGDDDESIHQLKSVTFTQSGTRKNVNAGLNEKVKFFLATGGRTVQTTTVNSNLTSPGNACKPEILKMLSKYAKER